MSLKKVHDLMELEMLSDSNLIDTDVICHICEAQQLRLLPNYPSLPRVASDCVPWRSGGRLGTCESCLCVQNPVDQDWHKETTEIYSQYRIYRQSAGSEQGVFSEGKQLVPRSEKIFQQALAYLDLKKNGRLLDIGCANGELLRYFSTLAPHWQMVGFEIDDKRRKEVEKIAGVEGFACGSLSQINKKFDIITLIHVFEHLPHPQQWLKDFQRLLNPNGIVLIQVPDPKLNPFNLLVADHCSHFILPDLINIAKKAGYKIIACSDKWVAREFSILITPMQSSTENVNEDFASLQNRASNYPAISIQWLNDIIQLTQTLPKDKPRGIWGTSIAATWVSSIMENVDFFVDEDKHRIGQEHLGRPVYSPEMIPADSHVFIALTPEIAMNIYNRWSHLQAKLHVPPALVY